MNQSSYLDVKSRTNEQYGDRLSKKLNLNIKKIIIINRIEIEI